MVWSALIMDILLGLIIASCLVASPWEAWVRRHDRKEAERQVSDLQRFQGIKADLLTAPMKQGVTAELARVKHRAAD
jgi:hypothetical protein